MGSGWSTDGIPEQRGVTAVVTGANSGLGLVTSRELARAGATVVMACRSLEKGEAAAAKIRSAVPGAQSELAALDLSDLDSVRAFAGALEGRAIDLLINNAGIMMTPPAAPPPTGSSCSSGPTTSATSRSRACSSTSSRRPTPPGS